MNNRYRSNPAALLLAGMLFGLSAVASSGNDVVELSARVVQVMKRALAITLPERLPEDIRKEAPQHYVEDYEEYHRFEPGAGFFLPEAVRDVDRKLYKAIVDIRKLPPSRKVELFPHLGKEYFVQEKNRDLQKMIVSFLVEIETDAVDIRGRDEIAEPVYLKIIEKSPNREDRLALLDQGLSSIRLSANAYLNLVEVAKKTDLEDKELRRALLRALTYSARDAKPPAMVKEFLLEIALKDPCEECRREAIDLSQVVYFGEQGVVEAYIGLLGDALRSDQERLAGHLIWVIGIKAKKVKAVPTIISALDARQAVIRTRAILALQRIADMPDEEIVSFGQVDLVDYGEDVVDPASVERLKRAVTRWKEWWDETGERVWRTEGEDAFRRVASRVYASR